MLTCFVFLNTSSCHKTKMDSSITCKDQMHPNQNPFINILLTFKLTHHMDTQTKRMTGLRRGVHQTGTRVTQKDMWADRWVTGTMRGALGPTRLAVWLTRASLVPLRRALIGQQEEHLANHRFLYTNKRGIEQTRRNWVKNRDTGHTRGPWAHHRAPTLLLQLLRPLLRLKLGEAMLGITCYQTGICHVNWSAFDCSMTCKI